MKIPQPGGNIGRFRLGGKKEKRAEKKDKNVEEREERGKEKGKLG
jgi:hypothetical protein